MSARIRARRITWVGAVAAAAVALSSIAGQAQGVQAISASDRQTGAKAHPQLLQEFGGAVTGPQASYVETVGRNIAVQSNLSNARSDFTITMLNSPVENAMAIPGGYVYVTRQLVALMNNEAELAGVLGHEVAHVAARHAAKRQSAATRNSVLGALGSILAGTIFGNSQFGQIGQSLFGQGSQLLTLQFSRSQELEADALGIGYLRNAGYDPRAMSTVLANLANQNALDARLMGSRQRAPEWASTHPDPASRVRTAAQRAGNVTGTTNRDTFLSRIDGLRYGDDPRQGIVDGRTFVHPDLKVRFDAPAGFFLVNGTRSVSISGQTGKGEFTTAAFNGSLETYISNAFAGLSQQRRVQPASINRTTVNGIPAAYGTARVNSQGGQVDVVVFAYQWSPSQAYHFLTISQAGRAGALDPMFRSVRRITTAEANAVQPRQLNVVTVRAGDTVQSLAARMAYTDAKLERFLVLNGLTTASRLTPGQKVKIITT